MKQPSVCAILLTANRPEMTRRAVECFRAQTYDPTRRMLLVMDSGNPRFEPSGSDSENEEYLCTTGTKRRTIGELRNHAITGAEGMDIICHWDSDDYSHPNRIAEQVALLQASGADCVGYNEMLFWKVCPQCRGFDDYCADVAPCETCKMKGGEAWLYTAPPQMAALGTSLCYWRKTWEKKPFTDTSSGEDLRFIEGLNVQSYTSLGSAYEDLQPRMVARIHGGNTHCRITDQSHEPEHLRQWKRVPEWDARLRSIMESNSPRPAEGTASKPTPRQTP